MDLFVGIKAIVQDTEGRILLVRESSNYEDKNTNEGEGKWDVIGGRIEPHEKLMDGFRREIKEESGLDIDINHITLLTIRDNFPTIKGQMAHVVRIYYVCQAKSHLIALSVDHDRYEWILPSEAANYNLYEEVREVLGLYGQSYPN